MPLLDATGPIDGTTAAPLPNTTPLAELLARAEPLCAIAFSAFTDGRGFSLARALRDAGWRARLRASGELIPHQFAFALECGFDEVEISAERLARQPAEQWAAALAAVDVSYRPSARLVDIGARRRAERGE